MKQPFSIQHPVGAGEMNLPSDLEATRNALAERRLCRRSLTGRSGAMFKADLTAGICIFQRQAGLEPDGLVTPGGPTALALAVGGDVQVRARTPAHLSPECLALERNIADVERQIADAEKELSDRQKELDGLRLQRSSKRAELDRMLRDLGLGSVPSGNNLGEIFRRLENVPEEFRLEALRVADKTQELIQLVAKIEDVEADWRGEARKLTELDRTLKNLNARRPVVCG